MSPLRLFYAEPDPDRWLPFDRYPRRAIRRLVRGPLQPGGMMRYFLNLCDGLRRIGVSYRVNDFRGARKHPDALLGIIGKPHLLHEICSPNPILFGPAVLTVYPAGSLGVWAAGIDTYSWKPSAVGKDADVLVYDKVRWNYPELTASMLLPISRALEARGLRTEAFLRWRRSFERWR